MDLYHHRNPLFTKWVVAKGLLSTKFVVIDIGVQGGEHPRWQFLDPHVEIYGFDAIAEVIDDLERAAAGARHRRYYNIALGDEDGERLFFVSANRFGSSFFSSDSEAEKRVVPIRRLDTLYREGLLPRADYIKLDCEGFEPEILKGARQYLAASDVICVTTETNFEVSPAFPRTHFQAINEILGEYRLVLFDENHIRTPAAEYSAALAKKPWPEPDPAHGIPPLVVGRPRTYDIVFCPDLAADRRDPDRFGSGQPSARMPSVDMVIKAMINFELHGLMDCAVELAATFRDVLASRLDFEKAIELLLAPAPSPRSTADVTVSVQMLGQLQARMHKLQTELHRLQTGMRDRQARARPHEVTAAPPSEPQPIPMVTWTEAGHPSILIRLINSVPPAIRRTLRKIIGERSTRAILYWLFG
jgi:FkbM family methyltransferase